MNDRALVLGGGGVAGIAWMTGLLFGLSEEGFDRLSGTGLVDAVAASCAVPGVWPPVTIEGRRYMDGGVRSSDNADLAQGYARIVIVSPIGLRADEIVAFPLREQIDPLKTAGAKTYLIEPGHTSRTAIGLNPLLPATRKPVAEAGRKQSQTIAKDLKHFWN
jgi:NTE family protein